jgi:glycosyltransferase involved in cell wall biosynthesis
MDTQGVSRDEAMASGLVPITNAVAAIPEFVDEETGMLAAEEDFLGLADSIEYLYLNPAEFLIKSEAAANRIQSQRSAELMCSREIAYIV